LIYPGGNGKEHTSGLLSTLPLNSCYIYNFSIINALLLSQNIFVEESWNKRITFTICAIETEGTQMLDN
jgi:hypothetical protein